MALKIRGNSQILNGSIEFAQLQDLSAGIILGRAEGSAGAPAELTALQVRQNAGLDADDNVEFAAQTLNGDLDIKDSNDASKFTVASASGNTVVEGTLDSKGDFAVGNDQLTISSAGALNTSSTIDASGALTAASANFGTGSGTLVAGASTLASVDASSGSVQAGSLISNNVTLGGGSITSTTISGSTGSFTTLAASSTLTIQTDALVVDGSGDVSMSGDLTVTGSLDVMGSLTTIDTQNLLVEDSMIQLAKGNTSTDSKDIGFIGYAGNNNYAGLVRDSSDADKKFHLFTTSEDLSSEDAPTFTSGAGYAPATLVADIEGDVTGNADSADAWSSARTVTFATGDVTGSFSMDGSANVADVDLTIEASSVTNDMLAGSIAVGKIDFKDNSAALGTSNDVVPSQAAVKSYVDAAVSSGGLTGLEEGDMQMAYNNGSSIVFTKVKELIINEEVSSDEETAAAIDLATASNDQFDHLSCVYLNGQKLRFGSEAEIDAGTYEYWLDSSNSKIKFATGIIEEEDDIEIRYYIVS